MLDHCPGAVNLMTPTLSIKKCPQCGEEVEIFSNDLKVACSKCGFVIFSPQVHSLQLPKPDP